MVQYKSNSNAIGFESHNSQAAVAHWNNCCILSSRHGPHPMYAGKYPMFIIDRWNTLPVVEEWGMKKGVCYLDLSRPLATASTYGPITFDVDTHYTEFTHRIIGEYVADCLSRSYKLRKKSTLTFRYLGIF
jgi:hypothetical protein